jgi:Response regulator containing CheY-like receiver, AAA-type ATPase, and DNA-binding domains
MEPLLLVEDKNELRAMLRKALERHGHSVDEAADGSAAIQKLRSKRYQMVLTDLKMPGASGLDVLRESKQADSTIPVILLTAFGSVDEAVSAMKEGAFDFIQKPVDLDHLKLLVERATRQQELLRENLILREEFASRYGFPRIVGESRPMQAVSQQLQKVATTETTVLLLGESGTGKELFARAIHHVSNRRDQAFVALNCAAIPESLVENELFGHERGAFTGAGNRKVGKIELAQRGTLFLDEIGELPLASQAKLLRVLEERRFERVGGTQSIEVDVRIVVATNRDLAERIREKLFREDLYFRISAVPLTIPPLRDRVDDIDILADHFLEKFSRELGKPPLTLSSEARHRLREYPWPGNVRELQNALERAVILADGTEISRELLVCKPVSVNTDAAPANLVPDSFSWEGSFDDVTARAQHHVERVLLENALKETRWNKSRAAEKLGITPKTLLAKMRATGLEPA